MVDAIICEIELTEPYEPGSAETMDTLYFGGGTPSLLSAAELEKIIIALKQKFSFSDDLEFTLEANPDDINKERLKEWRSLGVNRFSIGIQDFDDAGLKWMNRVHTAAESLECINQVINSGFTNFSIDLIYGSPLLTDEQWNKNLDLVFEKNVPHISCYALTVESGTALDKMIGMKKREPVDPDKQARHFEQLIQRMEAAGYEQYEISNFARPGMHSKHNSSYWQGKSYYGFGPSAHSFNGNKRRWNIAHNALYIQSIQNGKIPFEEETLTPSQQLNEYIMTSLRTKEGIDLDQLEKTFGRVNRQAILEKTARYISTNKMIKEDQKLKLSAEGKLFADGIAADLFF